MKTYKILLTKKIVVEVDAATKSKAMDIAVNNTDGFDGAWDRAEAEGELLDDLK